MDNGPYNGFHTKTTHMEVVHSILDNRDRVTICSNLTLIFCHPEKTNLNIRNVIDKSKPSINSNTSPRSALSASALFSHFYLGCVGAVLSDYISHCWTVEFINMLFIFTF